MIEAAKSPRFERWFQGMVEKRLAAQFAELRVHGMERFEALARERSVILVANHTAWWDPMLSLWAAKMTQLDTYAIMNAANLRAHAYFSRVGAVGVDLDDPADGARFLRYGSELLRRPGRAMWVFAQGQERPPFERPLRFLPGAAALARLNRDAACVPVGLRYVFARHERPVAYLSFGEALPRERKIPVAVEAQVQAVEAELARIEADESAGMPDDTTQFTRHLVHRPGFFERLGPRLLARLMAPPALTSGKTPAAIEAAARSES